MKYLIILFLMLTSIQGHAANETTGGTPNTDITNNLSLDAAPKDGEEEEEEPDCE